MSRLTELAVAKRSVTLLLAFGVFMAGIFSWGQLNQELVPNVDLPIITVLAAYPGAGATDVTEQVTKPIERAIASVPRLEHVQSTSSNSISVVVAQFSYGTDVKGTQTAIEQALGGVQLPTGVAPKVTALDINATPVVTAAVQGVNGTTPGRRRSRPGARRCGPVRGAGELDAQPAVVPARVSRRPPPQPCPAPRAGRGRRAPRCRAGRPARSGCAASSG